MGYPEGGTGKPIEAGGRSLRGGGIVPRQQRAADALLRPLGGGAVRGAVPRDRSHLPGLGAREHRPVRRGPPCAPFG
jgi:hypothetical protein